MRRSSKTDFAHYNAPSSRPRSPQPLNDSADSAPWSVQTLHGPIVAAATARPTRPRPTDDREEHTPVTDRRYEASAPFPSTPNFQKRRRGETHAGRGFRRVLTAIRKRIFDDEFVSFRTSLHPGIAVLLIAVLFLGIISTYRILAFQLRQPTVIVSYALTLLLILGDCARNLLYLRGKVSRSIAILAGHFLALVTLYVLALGVTDRINASTVCWLLAQDRKVANVYCLKSLSYSALSFTLVPHILPVQFAHIFLVFGVNAVIDFFFYGFGLYLPATDLATAVARMIFYAMVSLQQLQLQWCKETFDRRRLEAAHALVAQVRELRRDNARIAALMRSLAPTESFHELLARRAHRDATPLCTVVVLSVASYSTWVLKRRPKASAELLDIAVTFFDVERAAAGLEKLLVRGDAYGASLGLRPNQKISVEQHRPLPALKFARQVCSLLQETAALVFTCGVGSGQCSGEVIAHPRLSYVATGPALREAWALCLVGVVNVPLLSSNTTQLCSPSEVVLETISNDVWKCCDVLPQSEARGLGEVLPEVASAEPVSVNTSTTSAASLLRSDSSVSEDHSSLPMAVVNLPSLHTMEGESLRSSTATPATTFYAEVQSVRKRSHQVTWMCCERWHPSYAAAAARHTQMHRSLVLANLCTLNLWMFAATAASEALQPLSVFFFALCVLTQLLQLALGYFKSMTPVFLARVDLVLVFAQLLLLAAQMATSEPCVVNARWVYLLFAGGFAVIPALAAAHWAIGSGLVTVAAGVLAALNHDAPAPQVQLIGAAAFVACIFVIAYAQESDLRSSWLNELQSEAVMAVANEEKQLHEELLRALLPEYIVSHVQAKREQTNWTCVAEKLYDVAMAHIRISSEIEVDALAALAHRLSELVADSPAVGLVSLDGDQAVIAGPLQSPRAEHDALADSVFYTRSQHRLTEERYANDSSLALLEILRALYEPLPFGVATTALHRRDGLAVVLGVEEPRFAVLGPVSTVAAALAYAAPDGAVVMTDAFHERLGAEEWPSGLGVSAAATWRLQSVGCIRVRCLSFSADTSAHHETNLRTESPNH